MKVPGGKRVEEARGGAIYVAERRHANERCHDIVTAVTMRKADGVSNLMERDCTKRAGVEDTAVAEVRCQDHFTATHPAVSIDAPDGVAGLVRQVVRPADAD